MKRIRLKMENFLANTKLGKEFNSMATHKEKKQVRLVLLALLGLTLILIALAISYREGPRFLRRLSGPATVVSQQFPSLPPTATPTPKLTEEKKAVEKMITPLRGEYGIYFQDLASKDSFSVSGQKKFIAASLIKLPVILTLYREAEAGRINLETVYKLQAADKQGGAGSLQGKPVGYEITYRKMAELMGQQSDNTAFYIVAKTLGEEKIQATINALGMKNTPYKDRQTSPEDIGLFFRKLYQERIVSEKNRDEILAFLTNTIWEDRIPAGIPKGIRVAHKIGSEAGVVSDGGIVFAKKPFILVIMTENANEIEAKKALPEITKKIYEMWEQ